MPIVIPLIIVVLALLLALLGVVQLRAYVKLAGTSTTDVASVTEDVKDVALSGTARPLGDLLPSRFEEADTLVNRWDFSEYRRGENSKWVRLESGMEAEPFLLDDGTGEIVVDPTGADWMFGIDFTLITDVDERPPRRIMQFLHDHDRTLNAEKEGVKLKRRYREKRLDPGDDVFVYGPVKPGRIEGAPGSAVDVSIGTDRRPEDGNALNTGVRLTPSLLPFVGDPAETLSLGGASEGSLFTVADASHENSKSRYLKTGVGSLVFSAVLVGIAYLAAAA